MSIGASSTSWLPSGASTDEDGRAQRVLGSAGIKTNLVEPVGASLAKAGLAPAGAKAVTNMLTRGVKALTDPYITAIDLTVSEVDPAANTRA